VKKVMSTFVVALLILSLGCGRGEYDDESLSTARGLSTRYGGCAILDIEYSFGVDMLAEDIYAAKTSFNTMHGDKANNYFANSDLWTRYLVDSLENVTYEDGTRKYMIDEPVIIDNLYRYYYKGRDENEFMAQQYAWRIDSHDIISTNMTEDELAIRIQSWIDQFDIKRGYYDKEYWKELVDYLYIQFSEAKDIEVIDQKALERETRIKFIEHR